jgi:hypothetical protein
MEIFYRQDFDKMKEGSGKTPKAQKTSLHSFNEKK